MEDEFEKDREKVEERIVREFLLGLHESGVKPQIPDIMEELMYESDFGGEEEIVEKVEDQLLPDGLVVEDGD